jgi:acyl-CoA thioester hydrolase
MPRETSRMRVAFVDVDSSQRIHFTAMLRYFEVAEHALMRALGLPYATVLQEYRFPRVHLDCDFHAAIVYDDELDVEASVDRVGTSSWTVRFTARKVPDGTLAAEGHMTIVAMDPETERATPLPDELRQALTADVAARERA